jgi:hypothetical protein
MSQLEHLIDTAIKLLQDIVFKGIKQLINRKQAA